MTDHGETLRLLLTEPACIDAAVKWLDEYAQETRDARAWSDLGAALYVRAQKDDRASDLLRSHEAAKHAVAADPRLPAAQFNLALAQEALGFSAQARATWNRVSQLDSSKWAAEAKEHMTAIDRAAARNVALQWRLNRERLPQAVAVGDRRAVSVFIRPFPAATQKYLEEEALPAWAAALEERRTDEARRRLREATVIAEELEKATGDPYMREVVECVATAPPHEMRSLQKAHAALATARRLDRNFDIARAEATYSEAARLFAGAGSPLRLGAELGRVIQISRGSDDKREVNEKIGLIVQESRERGYLNMLGRAQANIANLLRFEGHYLEALSLYDDVLSLYERMNDEENLANTHSRKAGILGLLGQPDLALREAFLGQRHSAKVVEMAARHVLAGETASAALALDFPRTAFEYQTAFIDTLEREANDVAADPAMKNAMRVNRAIALRARAAIRLHLGDRQGAQKEIDEAVAISETLVSEKTRNALRARIAEAEGDAALPSRPDRAIEAFTAALTLSGPTRYRTFQAILLARRAEAYSLAGDEAAAERDLVAAIAELNAEEAELMAGRRGQQREALWSGYFSRFQETYYRLIALLLARGRKEDAFSYAEKSRAFEPLSLVLELLEDKSTARVDPSSIAPESLNTIRAALPVGTFILEYQVGEQRTFVWVVSRDDIEVRTLEVRRRDITEWIRRLQREAVTGDAPMFDSQLSEPYAKLFATPLGLVATLKNGQLPSRRLVIVPDRYMHGLPFAILRNRRGRHLVQDFTISIAPSATLYVHALRRDQVLAGAGGAPKALLIGNPAFDRRLELARDLLPLPFAEVEARNAAALYAPHAMLLVNQQATVPAFLSHAKDSVVVHIAGHAIVNRHAPFGTLLLLAPANGHDGLLYTEELLRKLELDRARLVVLAACSSAGGAPVGSEGLAPMVRPIVAAGVPGIVGSLWAIDDQRSQRVLSEFHRHYRDGHDAARALQLAQIRFLKEGKVPMLALAPFQVVGHASSPFPLNPHTE